MTIEEQMNAVVNQLTEQERQIEEAIYTALTLYAFHQQGCERCVSAGLAETDASISKKNSFGHVVSRLAAVSTNREGVLRRFNQMLTANTLTELSTHARGLIGMMKKNRVIMDYPSFALDLYHFQQPDAHRNVLLAWGKDFYMHLH